MWKTVFLAIGLYVCLLGLECMALDKVVLVSRSELSTRRDRPREISPAEWAPWSLLSVGAVTMLYSFTIPNRAK
jgi:hypothetical protein